MTVNELTGWYARPLAGSRCLGWVLCLAFWICPAQERHSPRLYGDIVTEYETSTGSYPKPLGEVNGLLMMQASDTAHGSELWATDGLDAWLVKDIKPGAAGVGLGAYLSQSDLLWFGVSSTVPHDPYAGLWVTDGTTQGTQMIKASSDAKFIQEVNGFVYFQGGTFLVYRSDGTPEGTVEYYRGSDSGFSTLHWFHPRGQGLLVAGHYSDSSRDHLWFSNGTEPGNHAVFETPASYPRSDIEFLVDLEDHVYFLWTASPDCRIMRTHGGPGHVEEILDVDDAWSFTPMSGEVFFFAEIDDVFGIWKLEAGTGQAVWVSYAVDGVYGPFSEPFMGALYFAGVSGDTFRELWRTDGTDEGTILVKDIHPDEGSYPYSFLQAGADLYFRATEPNTGRELWKTDGTAAGTQLIANPDGTSDSTSYGDRVEYQDHLVFQTLTDQLWVSDGTPGGTGVVFDAYPGTTESEIDHVELALGKIFFAASTPQFGMEPWLFDGSEAHMITDINAHDALGSNPRCMLGQNDQVFFLADYEGDTCLHVLDNLSGFATRLNGFGPHREGLALANGLVFFSCYVYGLGYELWATDGSPEGTALVKDVFPGTPDSNPAELSAFGDRILFVAKHELNTYGVWASDGTESGTVLLVDGLDYHSVARLGKCVIDDKAYFVVETRLYETDGTLDGTIQISETPSDGLENRESRAVQDSQICAHRDRVFYTLDSLYATDSDRQHVEMLRFFPSTTPASSLCPFGDDVVFFAGDTMWKTDGTEEGTQAFFSFPERPDEVRGTQSLGQVFLSFVDFGPGPELWRSDGTASGTVKIAEVPTHGEYVYFDDRLYFTAWDEDAGFELWVSDGSAPGTHRFEDLAPGFINSNPRSFSVVGSLLFFSAFTEDVGRELWALCGTPAAEIQTVDRVCGPNAGLIASTSYAGPFATYTWTIENGTITSGQGSPCITYDTSGAEGVELGVSVTAYGGCQGQSMTWVVVDQDPPGQPSPINGPDTVCPFESGVLFSVDAMDDAQEFVWAVPPGADIVAGAGSSMIEVDFGQDGGSVSVYVHNSCGDGPSRDKAVRPSIQWVQAEAGPALSACGTQAELQADDPPPGIQGQWTLLSGFGGTIIDANAPDSLFTGLPGEFYRVQWSLDHGACGMSTDETTVRFFMPPSLADAGSDQEKCGDYVYLDAMDPVIGEGHWEILQGTGSAYFSSYTHPHSRFDGERGETYELAWTVENGVCPPSSDTVWITFFSMPQISVGPDQVLSSGELIHLGGTATEPFVGLWTVEAGPSLNPDQILEPSAPDSAFLPDEDGLYALGWKAENGLCQTSLLTVRVSFDVPERTPRPLLDADGRSINTDTQPVIYNGEWVFIRDDDDVQGELWATDGTQAGTRSIRDISEPDPFHVYPPLLAMNGQLFFWAYGAGYQKALWKSDGTHEGTVMVSEKLTQFHVMTVVDDWLYIYGSGPDEGCGLWRSDGTDEGTVLFKEVQSCYSSTLSTFESLNGRLIFVDNSLNALCVSDGTEAGTQVLCEIGYSLGRYVVAGSHFYFTKDDPDCGTELWKTDGTPANTEQVVDLSPGSVDTNFYFLESMNGLLYFSARRYGENDPHLWVSDGTAAGTALVPGNIEVYSSYHAVYDGFLYLYVGEYNDGILYRTDGTQEGMQRLGDQWVQTAPCQLGQVLYFGGSEVLGYSNSTGEFEQVRDLNLKTNSRPKYLESLSGQLVFKALGPDQIERIYTLNPNPGSGTQLNVPTSVCGQLSGYEAWVEGASAEATFSWEVVNGVLVSGQDTPSIQFGAHNLGDVMVSVTITHGVTQTLAQRISVLPSPLQDWAVSADVNDLVEHVNGCF